MRTYLKKLCQYMIDLKYLNKHLFSKNNVFLVFINDRKKYRIPLVDQKVIDYYKTKNTFESSHVVDAKVRFPTNKCDCINTDQHT